MTRMAGIIIISLGAIAVIILAAPSSRAQTLAPRFEVDLSYPKPLPNKWVTGGIGGHCIDADDHVLLLNRQDVLDGDLNAGRLAPFMIELDTAARWCIPGAIESARGHRCRSSPRPGLEPPPHLSLRQGQQCLDRKLARRDDSEIYTRRQQAPAADRQEGRVRFLGRHQQGRSAQLERGALLHARQHPCRSGEWRHLRRRRRNREEQQPHHGAGRERQFPAPMAARRHGLRALHDHRRRRHGLCLQSHRLAHSALRQDGTASSSNIDLPWQPVTRAT